MLKLIILTVFLTVINACCGDVHEVITETENVTVDYIQIGGSIYMKEKIDLRQDEMRRISVNHKGDIIFHYGFTPFVMRNQSSRIERVSGISGKINDLVLDSKDNIIFSRGIGGLYALLDGADKEVALCQMHKQINAVAIDIFDNVYLGSLYNIEKLERKEGGYGNTCIDLIEFHKGFVTPAAVDSMGNIYFKEDFRNFYYQNLKQGISSRTQIQAIGSETALGAAVDSKDNVYVATTEGLFFIRANSRGKDVQRVKDFGFQKISSVHVDWRNNDTIYVFVDKEGLYRLTYDHKGDDDVISRLFVVMTLSVFALLGH